MGALGFFVHVHDKSRYVAFFVVLRLMLLLVKGTLPVTATIGIDAYFGVQS